MQKPLRDYKVTCKYGVKRKVKCTNGKTINDEHSGVDLVSYYDDVLAPAYGKVIFTTEDDGTGAKTVVTAHHNVLPLHDCTLLCLYTHLDKILVKENDVVTESTVLGKQGSSGNVSGKHLHVSCYLVQKYAWHKGTKYFKWDYKTRDQYEINPNDIFNFYEE